jgi:FkbM family methyltransferase
MSVVAGALRRTGSTVLGLPLVRLVAGLAQWRMIGVGRANRTIEALVSGAPERTVIVPLDLGGARCDVELDLSIPSCRILLVQSMRRMAEWSSIRLFAALARDAPIIIDVGANFGIFTYCALAHAPRARVLAYEPAARLADLLERNLARNGWAARVDVRRAAVSSAAGRMTFYVRETDYESTLEATSVVWEDVRERVEVPVVALDDVFEREGFAANAECVVVKIDVEGHEMRVLDGFERTLRRPGHQPTVLMEFLGHAITEERVIDRVIGLGINVYYVTSRSLVPVMGTADFARAQEVGCNNFLLTPRAPAEMARYAAIIASEE